MMATVRHMTVWAGRTKFQTVGSLFVGVYILYSVETPGDGQYICPKHLEFFIKINLRNSASCCFLL